MEQVGGLSQTREDILRELDAAVDFINTDSDTMLTLRSLYSLAFVSRF